MNTEIIRGNWSSITCRWRIFKHKGIINVQVILKKQLVDKLEFKGTSRSVQGVSY
jgi:hypothetical protein